MSPRKNRRNLGVGTSAGVWGQNAELRKWGWGWGWRTRERVGYGCYGGKVIQSGGRRESQHGGALRESGSLGGGLQLGGLLLAEK